MNNKYIFGSHNSMTGYKSKGIISKLVSLFSKCQNGTLIDQFYNNCIYFDIRYINEGNAKLVGAHGLWKTDVTIQEAIQNLDREAFINNRIIYVTITKEKGYINAEEIRIIDALHNLSTKVVITQICQKHPTWKCIKTYNEHIPYNVENKYKVLDWSSFHTLIPIPKLWKKLCKYNYKENIINVIDFVYND